MARISTYSKDATITSQDKLLGSNYGGLNNQGRPIFNTASYPIADLLTYFQENIVIDGGSLTALSNALNEIKTLYTYDEAGNITGLSEASISLITGSTVSDAYASAEFQLNLESSVLTFDGQGGFTVSEAFANQVMNTETTTDYASASILNNVIASIGTDDGNGNITISEAFANSVLNAETTTDYATASYVTNLATSIGTVDAEGNLTVSQSFANSVMSAENTTDYAQAQFVNNLASSIGTVDAQGNVTVSQSFANSVMSTENTTDYASAQSVTDLSATVSTKPDIFRQDNAPAITEAVGSLWYDTNDNNKLYVLVAGDPDNVWTLTDDERIGTLVDSTTTINQTLSTHATDISNNATFATNLAGSFGTYDAQGNLTGLSEAFANSVMNTETATDYASADSVTNLTATVNTKPDIFRQATEPSVDNAVGSLWYDTANNNQVYVLVDGTPKVWTLTDDSRIGTLVDSTATINQTLQTQATAIGNNATFATGLAGSFGTYDASTGELTALSEAFANQVFSTTTSTDFATSQSVTNLSTAVDAKPDVFRQNTEPSTNNAIGSIWYDTTNDANLPYVLVDVSGTKTWVATGDKRIVTNASSISNVSESLTTTNTAVSAAADKITELETQFTFDTEGNISGVADTLSQSISTARSDAESASASKVDTLAATFYTGYNNEDGTFTALNVSEAFANEVFDTTTSTNFASTDSVTTLTSTVNSKPDVFRQGSTTDGEPAKTGAVGSLWYDTEDNNKVYVLIDNAGTKEWAESTDGRVVTNANSISNVSDSLSTTNTNLSAAADKITELETQFTFDTEGGITGTSGTLNTEIDTAKSDAISAAAGKVETLAANFFTGYNADDGSLTSVSLSEAVQTAVSGVVSGDGYASANDLNTLTATVEGTDGTGGLVGSVSTLQSTVASKPEVFRSGTQPAVTEPVGSLWFDTANGNKAYILVAGNPDNTWEEATDTNIISSIADKPFIFRQATTQPATTNPVGSLWYDTADNNKLYVLTAGDTNNTWEATVDGTIATAQSAAEAAQQTADGRPKVFRQATAPATTEPQYSIWYDTSDNNKAYVLVGETWTETLDGRVGDLLDFVESSYAISTDANGVVTGMELYSRSGANSTLSEVKFTADKFVIKSSTVEATPFVLDSNSLKLNVPLNGVSGSFSGNLEAAGGTFRGAVDILDSDQDTVVKIHSGGLGNAIAVTGQSATFPNVSQITVDTWGSSDNVSTTGATISSLYDDTNQTIYGPAQSVTFAAGSYTHTFSTNASSGDVVTNSSDAYGFSRVNLGIQFGNSDFSTIYYDQIFPNVNNNNPNDSSGIPAVPSFDISLAFAQQTTVYVRLYVKRTWKLQMGSISFTSRTISISSDMAFAGKKGKAEMSPDGIKIFNTDDIYFKIDRANFTSGNPYVDIAGDVKIDGDLEITGDVNFSGDINNSDVTVANLQNRLSEIASNTYIGSSSGNATFTVRDNLVVDGSLTVNGTTTTVNTSNLSVSDNLIHVADNNNLNTVDLGIVGHYSDDSGVTANHVGMFWDASATNWKFFDNYTKDEVNGATVDTAHTSFQLAEVQAASFKVADGQLGFLKANGTIDTNTYASTTHNHDGTYLKLADGGTVSGDLNVTADVKIEDADLYLDSSSVNGGGGRRIRFTEDADSSAGYQGAYIHYNGDNNLFILGTHNAANSDAANDVYAIQMSRGTGNVEVNNNVTAAAFVKRNGTSGQFLKADGSTDANSYALSSIDLQDVVNNSGVVTTGITVNGVIYGSYGSNDTDITGLISGSTFGGLIKGVSTGHMVIGLRENGGTDSFAIVSGGGDWTSNDTYDKLVAQFRADGVTTIGGNTTVQGSITTSGGITASGVVNSDGLVVDNVTWNSNKVSIQGASPNIEFRDNGTSSYWYQLGANGTRFYILHDTDKNGVYEGTFPFELRSDTSIGYVFGSRIFTDNYHPNADKWTTARTVTFSGDISGSFSIDGSANVSNVNLQVANDSHTHDGRYFTETESDERFVRKGNELGLSQYNTNAYMHFAQISITANTTLLSNTWVFRIISDETKHDINSLVYLSIRRNNNNTIGAIGFTKTDLGQSPVGNIYCSSDDGITYNLYYECEGNGTGYTGFRKIQVLKNDSQEPDPLNGFTRNHIAIGSSPSGSVLNLLATQSTGNFKDVKIEGTTVINNSRNATLNSVSIPNSALYINSVQVTADAGDLNKLDGMTATTAELNKLDGFTGTATDLNYAKDLRATGVTTTEFDYLDGVTSNIQTQINNIDAFKYKSVADIEPADGYVSLFEMKTPSANLKGGSNALVYVRTRWVGSTSSVKTSCFFNITASEDGLITVEANSAEGSNVRYKIIQDNAYPSNYIFQIKSMLASALDVECFMFETTKKGSSGSGEIITTGFSTYTTPKEHDIYEFSGKRFISFDNSVTGTTTVDTGVTIDGSLTVNTINLTGLASSGGRTTETTTVLISSSGGTYPTPRDLAELITPSGTSARSFLKFTVFGGGEFLEKKYVCDWNNSASEWTINVATEESSGTYDVQYDFTDDKFKLHIVDGSTTLTYNAVTVTIDHLGEDVYYNSLA